MSLNLINPSQMRSSKDKDSGVESSMIKPNQVDLSKFKFDQVGSSTLKCA